MQITTLPLYRPKSLVINAIPTCSHRQDAAFLDRVQRTATKLASRLQNLTCALSIK